MKNYLLLIAFVFTWILVITGLKLSLEWLNTGKPIVSIAAIVLIITIGVLVKQTRFFTIYFKQKK